MTIRVSVVLPTYQRPELLARCLSALAVQDFDPAAYEIIVVDDGVCEKTRRVVEEQSRQKVAYCWVPQAEGSSHLLEGEQLSAGEEMQAGVRQAPKMRYLPALHSRGPAAARNLGWRKARGGIIAFIDDDCIPSSGWLKSAVRIFDDGVVGVSGQVIVPATDQPNGHERRGIELGQSEFATANCFYTRALLEEMGGFDERFDAAWREDSDLFFTLLEKEKPLAAAPQAVVFHPPERQPWGCILKEQRKSMYNALLYKKHPRLYRKLLSERLPGLYYLATSAFLLGPAAALAQSRSLALVSILVWLLLSLMVSLPLLQQTTRRPGSVGEVLLTSALLPPVAVFWRLMGALKFRVLYI
jgi:glycosyltransferase involved in cell wall biosynthesis